MSRVQIRVVDSLLHMVSPRTRLLDMLLHAADRSITLYVEGYPDPFAQEEAVVRSVLTVSGTLHLGFTRTEVVDRVRSLGMDTSFLDPE